jgi:molybdopterin converting factor small subunit
MASVRILLFATAREVVGRSTLQYPIPSRGTPLAELVDDLKREYPRLEPILKISRLVRNGTYVSRPRVRVRPDDEIAIHPPYSGG